jgi:hypothetical protein
MIPQTCLILSSIGDLEKKDASFFALIACAICAVAAIFVGRDSALEAAKAAKSRGEKVEEGAPMTVTP